MVVLYRRTIGVATRISRIVKRTMRQKCPIDKLRARVVGISVVVKNIDEAQLADSHHQPLPVHHPRELVRP